mmetsp:Transcript_8290/g.20941  ORF Transcript_8290/g.20941 Transcript_8290/m.20941 type:complete len:205 (+) Transcript_8290:792-1406(+)
MFFMCRLPRESSTKRSRKSFKQRSTRKRLVSSRRFHVPYVRKPFSQSFNSVWNGANSPLLMTSRGAAKTTSDSSQCGMRSREDVPFSRIFVVSRILASIMPATMDTAAAALPSTGASLLSNSAQCSSPIKFGLSRAPFGKSYMPELAPPVRMSGTMLAPRANASDASWDTPGPPSMQTYTSPSAPKTCLRSSWSVPALTSWPIP